MEKRPSNEGDQSSRTRTSCPSRKNGAARASIVYAIPQPIDSGAQDQVRVIDHHLAINGNHARFALAFEQPFEDRTV